MALNFGEILGGIGAAMGGTAPQYVQNLKAGKQADMAAREKALYEDAAIGLQLVESGDLQGFYDLATDRMEQLRRFPDAVPNDTVRLMALAKLGMGGELPAIGQLHAELIAATKAGQVKGYLQTPTPVRGVEVGGELRNPFSGEVMGPRAEVKRPTARDVNGVERYIDNLEPVLPGIEMQDTSGAEADRAERTAALTGVRQEVSRINKDYGEMVTAYNKVMSLESSMRNKTSGRGAINAAIMNVARLISPGVVTDRDAAAFSGASKTVTEVMNFLSGKGVDMDAIMKIADPTNPETFNVDALLDVARNVTSSAFPALQAQIDDQRRVAETYSASTPFMKSYFDQGRLQTQAQDIMAGIARVAAPSQAAAVPVRDESEALMQPVGTRVVFPNGEEAVVE